MLNIQRSGELEFQNLTDKSYEDGDHAMDG